MKLRGISGYFMKETKEKQGRKLGLMGRISERGRELSDETKRGSRWIQGHFCQKNVWG